MKRCIVAGYVRCLPWPCRHRIPRCSPARAPTRPRSIVRIGQDFTLGAGDAIREGVVILGNARIDGRVAGDMVVVLGVVQLSSTATIDGDLVVVGGSSVMSSGAQVQGDLVVVGGTYDAPADFVPGGEHVVIGPWSAWRQA